MNAVPGRRDEAAIAALAIALHGLPERTAAIEEAVHGRGVPEEDIGRVLRIPLCEVRAHLAEARAARCALTAARSAGGTLSQEAYGSRPPRAYVEPWSEERMLALLDGGMTSSDAARASGWLDYEVRGAMARRRMRGTASA